MRRSSTRLHRRAAVKILVVDDEPPIRQLLRSGLATQDYAIAEAADAGQAQAHLQSEKIDLIVLDLGLPGSQRPRPPQGSAQRRDGCAGGRVVEPHLDEAGIVQALELGADDYVTKPFSMNELIARIKVALRHRLQEQGEKPVFKVGELSVDLWCGGW